MSYDQYTMEGTYLNEMERNSSRRYAARIGFFDRYSGWDYETIHFQASSQEEAEKTACKMGCSLANRYNPDTFSVRSVYPIS